MTPETERVLAVLAELEPDAGAMGVKARAVAEVIHGPGRAGGAVSPRLNALLVKGYVWNDPLAATWGVTREGELHLAGGDL
jgi:hypothetical protein